MKALLDLFVPQRCIGCGQPNESACRECLGQLIRIVRRDIPGLDKCVAAHTYEGWLRRALLRYKSGDSSAVLSLQTVLVPLLDSVGVGSLVPIPSTQQKIRDRGFDTVMTIARRLPRRVNPVLEFARLPSDQVGLSALGRRKNMSGVFRAHSPVEASVVLIDDVVTTGATLSEAARALRLAGATQIVAICVCSA
jgi:ComF family protein